MNQVSIGRHILQLLIAALAVMAVAMLIFVRIFANAAVEYDIRQSLDRVAYKNSQGFGLGLPLTMKIAQKHGGTVLVQSRQGEGSTFTLLLPQNEWEVQS